MINNKNLFTIVVSFCLSLLYCLIISIGHPNANSNILAEILIFFPLALTTLLTIENIIFFILNPKLDNNSYSHKKIEVFGLCLGILATILLINFLEIRFLDWSVQLSNNELHSPIFLKSLPTVLIILFLSFAGYFYCRFINLQKQPPLVTVLGITSMYLGIAISIIWCIQVWKKSILLTILPINYIIIILKTIRYLIYEQSKNIECEVNPNSIIKFSNLNKLLIKSSNWPWLAAIAILPLLGIITIILILFGQKPDSIIKAWTETANWTFSQKTPPQNIYFDQHYLCTVAAGGHRKVVKPLREGKRHGHKVLVNRQLCIANAFEQVLEENLPKFHRFIRSIYDKYGYPIATKIKSPYTADIIYFLMKPLEWCFLIVLYLVDVKPENRIAIQYPHTDIPKF